VVPDFIMMNSRVDLFMVSLLKSCALQHIEIRSYKSNLDDESKKKLQLPDTDTLTEAFFKGVILQLNEIKFESLKK
jgi:hypothetical protein